MATEHQTETRIATSLLVGGLALAALGLWLFAESTLDSAWREAAERTIQLGLIVVVGGGVKYLTDGAQESSRAQAREREREVERLRVLRNQRIDLLRRARGCHVRVDFAKKLIGAHRTQNTWFEQSRELMRVRPEFAEIAEDLKTAETLFDPADRVRILDGLREIDSYLESLESEYARNKSSADDHASSGHVSLDFSVERLNLEWVDDFYKEGSRFTTGYDEPLTAVKSTIRGYIYGSR